MNNSSPSSTQIPPTVFAPQGKDRFQEHRGLSISRIDFKISTQENQELFILENTFHQKGGPARHLGRQLGFDAALLEVSFPAWADNLAEELEQGRDAHVICCCPDVRLDRRLCREFHQRVSERISIPPRPWDEVNTNITSQPKLR